MDRVSLKARGKAAFKANYWKCVVVALLLTLATSSFGGSVGANSSVTFNTDPVEESYSITEDYEDVDPDEFFLEEDEASDIDTIPSFPNLPDSSEDESFSSGVSATLKEQAPTIVSLGIVGILLGIFLFGPLEVGGKNFFRKNLHEPQEFDALSAGFKPNYLKNVGSMFLKNLFLSLWTLLFIIPGIVMSFAYALTPYILADEPEIDSLEAIRKSKAMMQGHKWELFVLHLSFLGWEILGILTLGILDIFYVQPYLYSSLAAFYEERKAESLYLPEAKA